MWQNEAYTKCPSGKSSGEGGGGGGGTEAREPIGLRENEMVVLINLRSTAFIWIGQMEKCNRMAEVRYREDIKKRLAESPMEGELLWASTRNWARKFEVLVVNTRISSLVAVVNLIKLFKEPFGRLLSLACHLRIVTKIFRTDRGKEREKSQCPVR